MSNIIDIGMSYKTGEEEIVTETMYDTLTYGGESMIFFQNPISANKCRDKTNMYCSGHFPNPQRFLFNIYNVTLLNNSFSDIGFLSAGVFTLMIGSREYISGPLLKVLYSPNVIIPLMIPELYNFHVSIKFYGTMLSAENPPSFRVDLEGIKFRPIA